MVNVDLSPSLLLGASLVGLGLALTSLRFARPWLARDSDIVISCVVTITGGILIFQGWRLDPLLLFGQLMTVSTAGVFAVEALRLRIILANQQALRQRGGPTGPSEPQPRWNLPPPAERPGFFSWRGNASGSETGWAASKVVGGSESAEWGSSSGAVGYPGPEGYGAERPYDEAPPYYYDDYPSSAGPPPPQRPYDEASGKTMRSNSYPGGYSQTAGRGGYSEAAGRGDEVFFPGDLGYRQADSEGGGLPLQPGGDGLRPGGEGQAGYWQQPAGDDRSFNNEQSMAQNDRSQSFDGERRQQPNGGRQAGSDGRQAAGGLGRQRLGREGKPGRGWGAAIQLDDWDS